MTRVALLRTLEVDEEAIEYILEAVEKAGYEPGKDFVLAMDAASSVSGRASKKGEYILAEMPVQSYTSAELIAALEEAL